MSKNKWESRKRAPWELVQRSGSFKYRRYLSALFLISSSSSFLPLPFLPTNPFSHSHIITYPPNVCFPPKQSSDKYKHSF